MVAFFSDYPPLSTFPWLISHTGIDWCPQLLVQGMGQSSLQKQCVAQLEGSWARNLWHNRSSLRPLASDENDSIITTNNNDRAPNI